MTAADPVVRRIAEAINRSAGQHRRAIAQGFAAARARLEDRPVPCLYATSGCNSPQGECLGLCMGGMR